MSEDARPERQLRWAACYNARDLGGYMTADGAITRWGALVRADSVGRLTAAGRAALEAYGIRTIIDLRIPVEVRDDPTPFADHATIVSHFLPLDPNARAVSRAVTAHRRDGLPTAVAVNAAFLSVNQDQIAAVLRAVADAPAGGVLVHCHAGRDRTGLVAALLLGVAGVADDAIVADYALSFGADARVMAATLRYLDDAHSGVCAYLRAIGLSDAETARLRQRLRG